MALNNSSAPSQWWALSLFASASVTGSCASIVSAIAPSGVGDMEKEGQNFVKSCTEVLLPDTNKAS